MSHTPSPHTSTVTFGFWVYLMTDAVLFAGLFATYAVLESATFGGPGGKELFSLSFVLTQSIVLLTSSFLMGLALIAAGHAKKTLALLALAATFILGASFVALELVEFAHLIAEGHGPATNAFLSAFFTLVGTHGLHVSVGLLWMFVVGMHLVLRGFTEGTLRKLSCLGLYWHFLDLIWIFLFTIVYLFAFV